MTTSDDSCPVCGCEMRDCGVDGNWHEYHCETCDREVLRPIVSDHGDGVSVEDLNAISSFGTE